MLHGGLVRDNPVYHTLPVRSNNSNVLLSERLGIRSPPLLLRDASLTTNNLSGVQGRDGCGIERQLM